jgi:hypothetical protein
LGAEAKRNTHWVLKRSGVESTHDKTKDPSLTKSPLIRRFAPPSPVGKAKFFIELTSMAYQLMHNAFFYTALHR